MSPVLGPVERGVYRVTGVDETKEMRWTTYTVALLLFNLAGLLFVYLLQRFQGSLPLNPQDLADRRGTVRLQHGRLVRDQHELAGVLPRNHDELPDSDGGASCPELRLGGNRHRDRDRIGAWLRPAVRQRDRQFLGRPRPRHALRPAADLHRRTRSSSSPGASRRTSTTTRLSQTLGGDHPTLAPGTVACQEAIKMLGTNGGGILNANSAHPFENPTPLTNFVQMLLIFAIPAGLDLHLRQDGRQREAGLGDFRRDERAVPRRRGSHHRRRAGRQPSADDGRRRPGAPPSPGQFAPGGNMEGKETRFGIAATSALFAVITTAASCGAVNCHARLLHCDRAAMIPLANIGLGEVIFGGVGAGLYGILIYAVLAIFIAGLMVGRTPEYLGKKIEPFEVKMAMLVTLVLPLSILGFAAGIGGLRRRAGAAAGIRRPMADPKFSTPSPRRPATTAPPSPASARTRPSTTPRSGSPCWSAAFL